MPIRRRRPPVLTCPECKPGFDFINRKDGGCPRCGVKLFLVREYLTDEDGYLWLPKRGWVKVRDWVRESRPQQHPSGHL